MEGDAEANQTVESSEENRAVASESVESLRAACQAAQRDTEALAAQLADRTQLVESLQAASDEALREKDEALREKDEALRDKEVAVARLETLAAEKKEYADSQVFNYPWHGGLKTCPHSHGARPVQAPLAQGRNATPARCSLKRRNRTCRMSIKRAKLVLQVNKASGTGLIVKESGTGLVGCHVNEELSLSTRRRSCHH